MAATIQTQREVIKTQERNTEAYVCFYLAKE